MKEILQATCNVSAVPKKGGGFSPVVEAILITSEPKYTIDESGGLVKARVNDTLRFSTGAAGLRALAKLFEDWANESEEIVSNAEGVKDQKPEKAGKP